MIRYFDEVIRPLVLILSEIDRYVRTFKDKDRDKGKNNKNNWYFMVHTL